MRMRVCATAMMALFLPRLAAKRLNCEDK